MRVCELLCQPGPSLFPYSTPSSPAATGNQTISRREIKGPISPSGSCKHGNSVWNTLPSSCKVVFPAVSRNAIKQHFLTKKKKNNYMMKTKRSILTCVFFTGVKVLNLQSRFHRFIDTPICLFIIYTPTEINNLHI